MNGVDNSYLINFKKVLTEENIKTVIKFAFENKLLIIADEVSDRR